MYLWKHIPLSSGGVGSRQGKENSSVGGQSASVTGEGRDGSPALSGSQVCVLCHIRGVDHGMEVLKDNFQEKVKS